MPNTASRAASMTVSMRRLNFSHSFHIWRFSSARQLEDGRPQVRAIEAARERDNAEREVSVDAVVVSRAVIRRIEPVRSKREVRQVIPRNDELCETLQREGKAAAG